MDVVPDYMSPRRNVKYGKAIDIFDAAKELAETAWTIQLINKSAKYSDSDDHMRFLTSHAKDLLHAIDMQIDIPGILFAPDENDTEKRKEIFQLYRERCE